MKWKKVRLTEICKPKQWKNLPISELTEEGYPVYGANGIIGKYKEFNHEFPTLAITCRGATCGTINITQPKSYITSNAMTLSDLIDDVDQMFLYYALNKRGFKDVITGAAQLQITREGLSKIVLDIPERKEDQLHIANILSKAENLIAQRKESIRLLDEFLKSTFAQMFINKDFPHHKLGELATKITDGEHKKPEYTEDGIPFISVKNITNGFLDFTDCKYVSAEDFNKFTKRCKPEIGDIIYTKVGATYGRACVVDTEKPFCLYVSVALIKPKKELVLPKFLQFAINHPYVKRQADKSIKGSGVPDLHLIEIKSFEIPLPSLELQTQFAQIVEKTEALKSQYQQSLQELENLYGSLSQKAFRGELSVASAK